jgi:hypothetical protein
VLAHRRLEGLLHDVTRELVADVLAEEALDHVRRDLAGAKAGQTRLALKLAQLLVEARRDLLPRDLDTHAALDGIDLLELSFHGKDPFRGWLRNRRALATQAPPRRTRGCEA